MKLVLKGLEVALNKIIRLDSDALEKTKKLEGKCVKIDITNWNMSFFLLPYSQGLELLSEYYQQPDTVISGTLFGLIKVGAAGATTSSLFEESITISGDTKTGEALRDILKNLDIDWEEQLSKIVGDSLAHPIAHHGKKIAEAGKRAIKSLSGNLSEYLHYESQQLPPPQAVENFIEDVSRLRDDVDRLEARLNRMINRKTI